MTVSVGESEFPVRLRFERVMTDQELLHFCAENESLQVERDSNGELLLMTPSTYKGSSIESRVVGALMAWSDADRRGTFTGPTGGFNLADGSMRVPDAAWINLSRYQALSEEERDSFPPICPEFVIEIRSKSDRSKPLQAKMGMWIANGAELAWLIDPIRKLVEIYRPGCETEVHDHPTSVHGDGPVAGFELLMERIWSWG